jgi:hypothetical protein
VITIGIDPHKSSLTAVALQPTGDAGATIRLEVNRDTVAGLRLGPSGGRSVTPDFRRSSGRGSMGFVLGRWHWWILLTRMPGLPRRRWAIGRPSRSRRPGSPGRGELAPRASPRDHQDAQSPGRSVAGQARSTPSGLRIVLSTSGNKSDTTASLTSCEPLPWAAAA